MTTLPIFQPEITTLESQLTALQQQLDELRQAEDIATQLLSTLADTLPKFEKLGAIARIKSALLGLFGDEQRTDPTSEEIFDAECLPQTDPTPKQLTIEDAIATNTPSVPAEADTPEVEPAPTVEKTAEQMNYVELVELTPTLACQRKYDGEIVCAYLGSANKKLAEQWQELLILWGCDAQIRTQPKRLTGRDIKYEVKIRKITSSQLDTLKATHSSPFQGVPAPKATAQVKKSNESSDLAGQSTTTGGSENDADNDAKPQVSLVLGKADNIYISYFVMVGSRTLGRVERLSATSAWSVPGMPGTWENREAAADALIAKREADRKLHQDTNDLLRARYGLPV